MQGNVVDNNTYNLIMALSKNLEACEVYAKYAKDGNQQLWNQLIQKAQESAQMLQQELMRSMSQQGGQFASGSQRPSDSTYARASEATGSNMSGQNQSQQYRSGTDMNTGGYNQPR
jgi:hypothetical protein